MNRQPLKDISDSQSNTVRLVQNTPPRLPIQRRGSSIVEERRNQFDQQQLSPSSSVLPTLPSQILPPPRSNTTQLFQGSALRYTHDDVSPLDPTTTQAETSTGSSASPATTHQASRNSSSSSGRRPKTSRSSKLKHVAVRDDKTFSVLDLAQLDTSQYPPDWKPTATKPPRILSSQRSHESLFHPTENDSPTKSPTSCKQPSTSVTTPTTPTTPTPTPVTPRQTRKPSIAKEEIGTSLPVPPDQKDPEVFGGIRIVPKTPDSKKEEESPTPRTPEPVPPLPLAQTTSGDQAPDASTDSPILNTKSSNISALSENPSDTGNYVVYDSKSSSESATSTVIRHPIHATSSADSGNYQEQETPSASSSVFGPPGNCQEQTPSASSSIFGPPRSHNSNYEVYGDPSSEEGSPSSSSVGLVPRPSQDSLAVAPLRPATRRSQGQFGYYKSRSRESLRTAPSLASISSVLTQEATRAVFRSGAVVQNIPPPSSFAIPGSWAEQALSRRNHMQAHPHQWSSQLSTVLSEEDSGTDRASGNFSSAGRRSSGFMSSGSRQYRGSGGSSVRDQRSLNSLERPQPAFVRHGQRDGTGSTIRMVGDEDEHGDHLTDMQDLRARPSRSRSGLSFFSSSSSDNGRRNSIQSTTSSRANSMLVNTIPTWARLYYGSGERRWLAAGAPGSSTEGSVSSHNDSRSGSPNTDHFPLSIYSPRRRPRETNPNRNRISPLRRSLEILPATRFDEHGNPIEDGREGPYGRYSRRWRTSSIWSPHLRRDRRAARLSAWQPPSFNWNTEDSWTGRRNVQIVMFVAGFIIPFAWMIAAFLPLPPNPVFAMAERQGNQFDVEWSASHPDLANAAAQEFRPVDEARYESARWWRRLNRCMSFVGILIIGTVVALVVLGTQDWGKS